MYSNREATPTMPATITVSPADLPLQCLYRWEKERSGAVYLTQPMGAGAVQDLTWKQAADQVRRIATWLQSHGWEPGSRVAVLGKNSAQWILADLAIQMAGFVVRSDLPYVQRGCPLLHPGT